MLLFLPTVFFFNHPATPDIYTLSLHDALPISARRAPPDLDPGRDCPDETEPVRPVHGARSPRVVRDPHVDRLVHREPGRRDPRGARPGSTALYGTGGAGRSADPGAHRGSVRLVVPAARVAGAAGG